MDLFEVLKKVDICFSYFSNKSLSQKYALPNKMFEAFYAGKPVIVNKNSDAHQFVKKYNVGWAISDLECDCKNILKSITKKDLETMSNNALKVSKTFNWENEQQKLKVIYKNL